MDAKLHSESMRAVEKALAAQRKSMDPTVAKAYQMCQMNMFLSKTVSSALIGFGVYGALGLLGRRAPAIAQYKTIPSMFSYTIAWDYLSMKLDSMCVGSMMSVPEVSDPARVRPLFSNFHNSLQGLGPELRRVYAQQYSASPYLQAAQDIADAAKRLGDVRMGRAGQLVSASSSEAIMIATPELLMQWRLATGSTKPALTSSSDSVSPAESARARDQHQGRSHVPRQKHAPVDLEHSSTDDGFLGADNERHDLDSDAQFHSRMSSVQDSAGEFARRDGSEHYDHEASGRFESLGSSLASSDLGLERSFVGGGASGDDWDTGEGSGGALGLPSMPSWGNDAAPRSTDRTSREGHAIHRQRDEPGPSLDDEESFALRRRLAMRGGRAGFRASGDAPPPEPKRSDGDFDEEEYFGR